MEENNSIMTETPQIVSIPTILNIVSNISNSDQCLHADAKLSEYIALIPQIVFQKQEEKNNYASELYTIQEEVRSKFNTIKIYPQTPAAYHLIRRHATEENLQHFTFQLPEDKKKIRAVIRGMPTDMPPEDIMQELDDLGFTPETCQKTTRNEHQQELKNILKEKRESRAPRPVSHTTSATYAEVTKNSPAPTSQDNSPTTTSAPASISNINEIFKQLKDPECLEMFGILKKFIAISKSGKSTLERFAEIMALLQIDQINV
ncbi:hypothetical protein NPIL_653711 [Nephila pilipes]|uniref:Uncharacterized protein n=1 Tax=Nephila pilipes TaxID=299642 RepID=A0A8X6P2D6_NEPPI|nr:hypothetical protein NPIL_653711 [Nephila pilipes]